MTRADNKFKKYAYIITKYSADKKVAPLIYRIITETQGKITNKKDVMVTHLFLIIM